MTPAVAAAVITATGVGFGLAAAVAAGIGDFAGGVASRRATPLGVTAVTWLGQVPLVVTVGLVLEGGLDANAILPGMAAGLMGAIGGVLLFAGLAYGSVAIVAATSAVIASVTAVSYDVVTGTDLQSPVWAGIVLALPAIVLVAARGDAVKAGWQRSLGTGIGAGVAIGMLYVIVGAVGGDDGDPTVIAILAATAGAILVVAGLVGRRPFVPRGTALAFSLAAAMLSGLHLLALLFAVEFGSIATGTVLASQYPAFTVVMAALIWRQLPHGTQTVGLVLALAAVGLIASGSG